MKIKIILKVLEKKINKVVENQYVSTDLPDHFITDNNRVIKNMNEVVNEFNSFFL